MPSSTPNGFQARPRPCGCGFASADPRRVVSEPRAHAFLGSSIARFGASPPSTPPRSACAGTSTRSGHTRPSAGVPPPRGWAWLGVSSDPNTPWWRVGQGPTMDGHQPKGRERRSWRSHASRRETTADALVGEQLEKQGSSAEDRPGSPEERVRLRCPSLTAPRRTDC